MQPFDALTIRAVLQEAKPILLNRKVDKVHQLGRDEIVLILRSKAGLINLLMSAQTAYGRLCLVKMAPQTVPEKPVKQGQGGTASSFCMLLRKHLAGATLVGVEQPTGERTVDFIFSCIDEVGGTSHKVLTAEIMGRHSNLIFWDKNSEKIICASHVVTREMSRQREVAPGLRFVRPPGQDKANVFAIDQKQFNEKFASLKAAVQNGDLTSPAFAPTLEQWLINSFTGLGRHLSTELVLASGLESSVEASLVREDAAESLWQKIAQLQKMTQYKPSMKKDLSAYSVLSWTVSDGAREDSSVGSPDEPDAVSTAEQEKTAAWKKFPAVNDMIEEYYRLVEAREQFNQLREKLRAELRGESDKLEQRIKAASMHLGNGEPLENLKRNGDLVLANIQNIGPGQAEITCENMFDGGGTPITITLNPNLSPAQNAQTFYRQFAKSRARQKAATIAKDEASQRLADVRNYASAVEKAVDQTQLRQIKETLFGRKANEAMRAVQQQQQQQQKKKNKSRLLSTTSSDGWTIYVGRNRQENDYMLSKLAQPQDLWLHIQGQGGAHVLIRVPASKQDPPLNTIKEAAHVAAKLSKAASGTKVRVVYTQCRFVKKIAKDKPGLVRYENERTLEVDTAAPMPKCMKQLFQHN